MTPEEEKIIRPSLKLLLRYWIIGICTLILVAPTDIPFTNRLIACLLSLLFFWTAYFPIKRDRIRGAILVTPISDMSKSTKVTLVLTQFIFIEIASRFYTGSGLLDGINGLFEGANTYRSYQKFFSESQISSQPPYMRLHIIFLLALGKLIFVAITCEFYLSSYKNSLFSIVTFLLSIIIYVSFGLTRGTFFEVFEVAIANIYFSMISKYTKPLNIRKALISISKRIGLALLPVLFVFNAMRRYDDPLQFLQHVCSSNFCFSPYDISFSIEYVLYLLSTYLSNGIYSVSVFYEQVLSGNSTEYLIPLYGYFLPDSQAVGVRGAICELYLNCRFVWVPDLTIFMSLFGLAAFLAVPLFIQYAHRLEISLMRRGTIGSYILLFYIAVFLISLPVGNFITTSSANILGLIITAIATQVQFRIPSRFSMRGRQGAR